MMRQIVNRVVLFIVGIVLIYTALKTGIWIHLKMFPNFAIDLQDPLSVLPIIVLVAFGTAIEMTALGALNKHAPYEIPYGLWRGAHTAFVLFVDALCFAFLIGLLFVPSAHGLINTGNLLGIAILAAIFPLAFAIRELSSAISRTHRRKMVGQ